MCLKIKFSNVGKCKFNSIMSFHLSRTIILAFSSLFFISYKYYDTMMQGRIRNVELNFQKRKENEYRQEVIRFLNYLKTKKYYYYYL